MSFSQNRASSAVKGWGMNGRKWAVAWFVRAVVIRVDLVVAPGAQPQPRGLQHRVLEPRLPGRPRVVRPDPAGPGIDPAALVLRQRGNRRPEAEPGRPGDPARRPVPDPSPPVDDVEPAGGEPELQQQPHRPARHPGTSGPAAEGRSARVALPSASGSSRGGTGVPALVLDDEDEPLAGSPRPRGSRSSIHRRASSASNARSGSSCCVRSAPWRSSGRGARSVTTPSVRTGCLGRERHPAQSTRSQRPTALAAARD